MKQRTRNILKAAEAALDDLAHFTLSKLNEVKVSQMLSNDMWEDEVTASCSFQAFCELRCLHLCFLAAMSETGDLP